MSVPINMAVVLTGEDTTGGAFKSVARNADALAGRISGAFQKAAAALPALLSGLAVKSSLNDLNLLNDAAQRAGVGARWLKQFGGAMSQFGVQMQQADIVSSVQKLNAALVNTEKIKALEKVGIDAKKLQGLRPEEAFVGFLKSVAQLEGEQSKSLALMRGLEEQGLKLAPILREGPDAFSAALGDVMNMIPAASDATVTLATNANNALALAGDTFKTVFYDALGSVLEWTEETFGGVDNLILAVVEAVRYRVAQVAEFWRTTCSNILTFGSNAATGIAAAFKEPGLILDWLQSQARKVWAVFKAIRDWISAKFSGEDFSAMDAFGQALVGIETEKANFDERLRKTGAVFKEYQSLGPKLEKLEAAHLKRAALSRTGLDAKKRLNVIAEAVPPQTAEALKTSVADAVGAGVKQGLAAGVEAGSYDVIKSAFKSASAAANARRLAALAKAAEGKSAENARPSKVTKTSPASPVSGSASAVPLLRDILAQLKIANQSFARIGAF